MQPEPSVAGTDLGVDDLSVAVFDDATRSEPEDPDQVVVPGTEVTVRKDGDDVLELSGHGPNRPRVSVLVWDHTRSSRRCHRSVTRRIPR